MTKPKLCDWCGEPIKDHVREGRYVICVGGSDKAYSAAFQCATEVLRLLDALEAAEARAEHSEKHEREYHPTCACSPVPDFAQHDFQATPGLNDSNIPWCQNCGVVKLGGSENRPCPGYQYRTRSGKREGE